MPKVFIIILNWNGLKDTLECLESLSRLVYPNFEVIVVDNCSSDDSTASIRRKFPRVFVIENSKNLGYTGGNNIGISRALEQGADYVWLLNNDTVVDPDTLMKLVDEAEQSPGTGLISPIVHFYGAPEEVQFIGARLDFANCEIIPVKEAKELGNEGVRRSLVLYGTALFIRKNVIETIGYLSEKYFAYQEDFDYSVRALRANFRTAVRVDARILHKDSRSTGGKGSPIQVFLMTRNAYYLWRDNGHWFRRVFVPGHFIGMMISRAKFLADNGNEKGFDACLKGVWAALKGNTGAYDPTFAMPFWFESLFTFFVTWHPYFWINFFRGNFSVIAQRAFCGAENNKAGVSEGVMKS